MSSRLAVTRVAIRADASTRIGTGHVMRCATLGKQLRQHGAEVHFICRSMPGDYCDWLENQGFKVHRLPAVPTVDAIVGKSAPVHVNWLGVTVEQEVADSRALLATHAPFNWLVVDHYGLDVSWETEMRSYVSKVLVIDDLADRVHDCDLLLDQNLFSNAYERYQDKVPAHCGMMLGPGYALLQREYAELHSLKSPRSGKVQRVLVSFGGHGYADLVGLTISAFLSLDRPDIQMDIVLGNDNPKCEAICTRIADHVNIHLHNKLPTLAHLMDQADLAIGASGATSWERCCLGLPSLVITLADNQRPIAHELDQRGLIRWLGHFDEVDDQDIKQVLSEVVGNSLSEEWSQDCWQLVDGLGATRVSANMLTEARANHAH